MALREGAGRAGSSATKAGTALRKSGTGEVLRPGVAGVPLLTRDAPRGEWGPLPALGVKVIPRRVHEVPF